jgi:PAS domain S-box-containing protein
MTDSRKTNLQLVEENKRLRAQVAQLEDRVDHLSEHGTAAKALRSVEVLYQNVLSVVADVVLIANDGGKLSYVSPNAHLIFGHSAGDILKQGRIGFILPGHLFDPDLLEQRGELANIDCQIRDSVGRSRNLLINVRRFENEGKQTLYVCRDVTDRTRVELDYDLLSLTLEKRVEEQTSELRESRERYRRLVEGLRDEYFFYATDRQGKLTYASPSIHSIMGYTPNEVIDRNWREFADTDAPTFAELEHFERMVFAGIEAPSHFAQMKHADGGVRMLELRDILLRDSEGIVIANEGIAKDVTRRHEAEEELRKAHDELERRVQERTAELLAKNEQLRQSQQRYLSVIQDQLEFIIRWREDGTRTLVNDSYCTHCELSADELIGSDFMSSIVEEDRAELAQSLSTLTTDNPVVIHDHRVVMPDGRVVWERWTHRALFNPQGKLIEFQSVGSDVTAIRRREEYAQARVQATSRLQALTEREYDVMRFVVAGDANKVIARKLELSIKTIEKHRSSLMKKLHVRSVPELVRFALMTEYTEQR